MLSKILFVLLSLGLLYSCNNSHITTKQLFSNTNEGSSNNNQSKFDKAKISVLQSVKWKETENDVIEARIEEQLDKFSTYYITIENLSSKKVILKKEAEAIPTNMQLINFAINGKSTIVVSESTGSMNRIEIFNLDSERAFSVLSELYSDYFFFIPKKDSEPELLLLYRSGDNTAKIRRYTINNEKYKFISELSEDIFTQNLEKFWVKSNK